MRAPNLRTDTGVMMVGVGALLGSLRGLKLVPSQWRCLVPEEHRDGAQSHPPPSSPLAGRCAGVLRDR